MAYTHLQYQVQMVRASASTADTGLLPTTSSRCVNVNAFNLNVTSGDNFGCANYGPGFFPVAVKAVAVETDVNLANAQDLIFRRRRGAATAPEAALFRMPLPTTTATGVLYVKRVTANVIINPGEKFILTVSTAVADVRMNAYILIEPAYEQLENVTTVGIVTG